jgi:hypothetical protein
MEKSVQQISEENLSLKESLNGNFFRIIEKIYPNVKNMSYVEFKKLMRKKDSVKIETLCKSIRIGVKRLAEKPIN